MDKDEASLLVHDLYKSLLRRSPAPVELEEWALALSRGKPFVEIFRHFISSKEFKASVGVRTTYAPGHYYSPVVDPAQIETHLSRAYETKYNEIQGIDIDLPAMVRFWSDNRDVIAATPFHSRMDKRHRYFFGEGPYPLGDAAILRLMMATHRPRHIVEIGSGFSTACMLDSADEFDLNPFSLTCIEPYPERLQRLLREDDKVELIPAPVQSVDPLVFSSLEANDILLIDSTHVLKTGSDVAYELFTILPVLKTGVLVHVHDCQFPFEYPRLWAIEQNLSWNEIYAIRAFLMFNKRLRVFFWNSLFAQSCGPMIKATYAAFLQNPGSAIWLKVL